MTKIKGKQLKDGTIEQINISITTASVTGDTSVTTKEYVDNAINSGVTSMTYSSGDTEIAANNTSGTDPMLACARRVTDAPLGGIRVFINGLEVNVGSGQDCFFAPEGSGTPTPRVFGDELQLDYLWWDCANASFQLETTDTISYMYMVYSPPF